MSWNAAVIGLGAIGQLYDYERDDLVVTHAKAYRDHPLFDLVAAVDGDSKKRALFEARFDLPAYQTIGELYRHHAVDVASICTPVETHLSLCRELVSHRPKALICEKPIADSRRDGLAMVELCERNQISLLVNYMRRFEPGVLALKREIERGRVGTIYKGTLWYSKGLLNNGSHFIDLLIFLFGAVSDISVLSPGRPGLDDPEPDLRICFGQVPVYFLAGREECYPVKELTLVGTKGSVCYHWGGIEIEYRMLRENPLFDGYLCPERLGEPQDNAYHRFQYHVLEALGMHLKEGLPLASDGRTALETLTIVNRIFQGLGVEGQ